MVYKVLTTIFLQIVLIKCIIVQLPQGKISGIETLTMEKTKYYAFEGIPYAKPPIGPLRFQAPVPADPWEGVLNGSTNSEKVCMQLFNFHNYQTEDCLFLNVYTPELQNGTISLPVMVFIFGGVYLSGYPQEFHPDLFINKGIIVITFNYRMGIFGYLTTQDEVIPPNNGLQDQILAIKWVKNNIHLFGGDNTRITLNGQSVGAASITFMLLDFKTKELFRNIIVESGTFLNPFALQRNAKKRAFRFGKLLNLFSFRFGKNSTKLLKYLQKVSVNRLQIFSYIDQAINLLLENLGIVQGYNWGIVLLDKQYDLLKNGNLVQVPTLMGINSEETLSVYPNFVVLELFAILFDVRPDWLVPQDMRISSFFKRFQTGLKIRKMYTKGKAFILYPAATIRCTSDNYFNRPIIKYAELYSKYAPTYFYEFSYNGILGHLPQSYVGAEHVSHAQELYYTFCANNSCNGSIYPKSDQLARARLVELWSNFVKYENPTPEKVELLENVIWPAVNTSSGDFYYLNINSSLEVKNHPKSEAYGAWNKLYDSLGYDDFDTY